MAIAISVTTGYVSVSLPNVTVYTGSTLVLLPTGNPESLTHWSIGGTAPLTHDSFINSNGSWSIKWGGPGSATVTVQARTTGGVDTGPTSTINVTIIDPLTVKFIGSRMEGWTNLPNTPGLPGGTAATYTGWSAPLAAAALLSYNRLKQPSIEQWFPAYVGTAAELPYMSDVYNGGPTIAYGNPSWRRFTLDSARPAGGATIVDSDQTDFGWWMNTDNLGKTGSTGPFGSFAGTTTKGLHEGLTGFYNRAGQPTAVQSIFKLTNTTLGTPVAEYIAGSATSVTSWFNMAKNLVDNNKPFMIYLSANSVRRVSDPEKILSANIAPSSGPEYVANINSMQVFTNLAGNFNQNDNATKILTPITGPAGSDLDHVTGNAYNVIGYITPTTSSLLPANARNKYLIIAKETGGSVDNENVYFVLCDNSFNPNVSLTGASNETSMWNRLISTHIVSVSAVTYVSPRVPIISAGLTQNVCLNVSTIIHKNLASGTPINHRFTQLNSGFGERYIRALSTSPETNWTITDPPSQPQTFSLTGLKLVSYGVSDAVSKISGVFYLNGVAQMNSTFNAKDNVGNILSASPNYQFAKSFSYTITPTIINPALTYQWDIQRTDAPPAPGDFTFISGGISTPGPIVIQLNVVGEFDITLNIVGACPLPITKHVIVTNVTLDFTVTPPYYVATPIAFHGSSNVSVSNWAWDFGDGNVGTGQNPSHTYSTVGTFNVVLNATTIYGVIGVTHPLTVIPASATADFYYIPTPPLDIVTGQTVTFVDQSLPIIPGATYQWAWDFGDGDTSTNQNPQHAYSDPGTYSVSLTYTVMIDIYTLTDTVAKSITIITGAPVVKSQTFIIGRNLTVDYDLSDYAVGNGVLTFTVTGQPTHGIASMVGSSIVRYQPLPASTEINYTGLDKLKFRATDSEDKFDEGNINLIIRPPFLQVTCGEILNLSHDSTLRMRVGTVNIGELRKQLVIFENTGTGPLFIELLSIVDDIAGVFGLYDFSTGDPMADPTNLTIEPNEDYAFYVGMQSSTAGEFKAKLKIDHN